ncbi:MAG: nickel pincer cofactor biosynthesis protein LarB [Phormidesmis sp. RL_2_1]|nr:nickel pincer cofactor biosynthesis protein LarB [Phormidesmis sp. RL_2_1]
MTQSDAIRKLFQSVAAGHLSPEAAFEQLQLPKAEATTAYEEVGGFAKIDHQRTRRTGFPEVIWGQDKTAGQIIEIMKVMEPLHPVVMATRVDGQKGADIQAALPQTTYFERARICAIQSLQQISRQPGNLSILTAGTADLPVAEEAAVTAELCGFQVTRLWDVGVAGIHRLLSNRHVIDNSDVLIVAAGMEGALPSVVAGLAQCPVIAVPTSIGYGASFQGLAPLLTMLNSCATGIGVVNIDNGFGAAILAGQILRTAARVQNDPS